MTLTIPRTTSTQPTARSTLILIPPQLNSTQLNSTQLHFNSIQFFQMAYSLLFPSLFSWFSSVSSLLPIWFPLELFWSPKPLIPLPIALPIDCLWLAIAYSLCAFLLPISLHVYHKVISEFHKHKYKLKLSFHSFQKKRRNHLSIGKRLSFRRFYF